MTALVTARLRLERLTAAHRPDLAAILSDHGTMSFWPARFTADDIGHWLACSTAAWDAHGHGRFAVRRRDDGRMIGDAGLMPSTVDDEAVIDIGWIIARAHWRQGFATEAARALVDHAFGTLGLAALHANMPANHAASRRVAERLGMVWVRRFANPRNRGLPTDLFRLTTADLR